MSLNLYATPIALTLEDAIQQAAELTLGQREGKARVASVQMAVALLSVLYVEPADVIHSKLMQVSYPGMAPTRPSNWDAPEEGAGYDGSRDEMGRDTA